MFLFMKNLTKVFLIIAFFFVVSGNITKSFAQEKTREQLNLELKQLEDQGPPSPEILGSWTVR